MEDLTPDDLFVSELFEKQRNSARSHDPAERLRTIFIGAMLAERLAGSSDHRIASLLSIVQDGLCLFGPEFIVCENAKRRLLKSSAKIPEPDWRVIRDAGIELLNAEAALFRAGIPHMLLPFQRDRFASNVFCVSNAAEARACLLRHGFRPAAPDSPVLLDAETGRTVRIVEAAGGEWETA